MGLLDGMLGNILGGVAGGGMGEAGSSPWLRLALQVLQQQGGIEGVAERLRAGGLGAQVDSWIGRGQNLPVSSDQLSNALGHDTLRDAAGQLGLPPHEAAGGLASILPQLIDGLTPNGAVTPETRAMLQQALSRFTQPNA
jgi:uncharacterized protein YidB (DUF937 family)